MRKILKYLFWKAMYYLAIAILAALALAMCLVILSIILTQ